MADGWGSRLYCTNYEPVYVGGEYVQKDDQYSKVGAVYDKTAFENPGCWFTITLPFNKMIGNKNKIDFLFDGMTLADVVAYMSIADYKQSGPWFENSGIKEGTIDVFVAEPATEKVYFDNIRIVPLAAPAYSDFPDE